MWLLMHTLAKCIDSFNKEAVLRSIGAESFFSTLDEIYACFDDLVKSAGMWKVEHVGEVTAKPAPLLAHTHMRTLADLL
jgi:hypothetical protein